MFSNNKPNRRVPGPIKGLFFLGMAVLVIFIVGHVIMFLWNTILVRVTGVIPLTYWEAIGLFILSRILFGSFHFGPKHHRAGKGKSRRAGWRDKWMNMTDEERADFKQKWKERCGKRS